MLQVQSLAPLCVWLILFISLHFASYAYNTDNHGNMGTPHSLLLAFIRDAAAAAADQNAQTGGYNFPHEMKTLNEWRKTERMTREKKAVGEEEEAAEEEKRTTDKSAGS